LIMQCREVCDLLDSFLGQELMVETNHELMRHLEGCPDCRAELEARRQLRSVLRRAFTATDALSPRPAFATDALARVRASQSERASHSRSRTWGALAASVVLVTAAGWLVWGNRTGSVARDAVGDHRNCAVTFRLAERPISLADAAARYDPVYARLQDTPPNEMLTAAGPLRVVDRHSCVFAGRRFGHVVMTLEGHLVSVLITAGGRGPGGPDASAVQTMRLPDVDGQRVSSFSVPGHEAFVVSDLPDTAFQVVAQALTGPLAVRLALLRWNTSTPAGD
jgi:hypothetical protein